MGQAKNAVAGQAGQKQKEQLSVLQKFRNGAFNVLVSTCIGEEGLDIGEVDVIVLFDITSSPTRMVQRIGRTARKRNGRVVLLAMEGKEQNKMREAANKSHHLQGVLKLDCFKLYPHSPRISDAIPLCMLPEPPAVGIPEPPVFLEEAGAAEHAAREAEEAIARAERNATEQAAREAEEAQAKAERDAAEEAAREAEEAKAKAEKEATREMEEAKARAERSAAEQAAREAEEAKPKAEKEVAEQVAQQQKLKHKHSVGVSKQTPPPVSQQVTFDYDVTDAAESGDEHFEAAQPVFDGESDTFSLLRQAGDSRHTGFACATEAVHTVAAAAQTAASGGEAAAVDGGIVDAPPAADEEWSDFDLDDSQLDDENGGGNRAANSSGVGGDADGRGHQGGARLILAIDSKLLCRGVGGPLRHSQRLQLDVVKLDRVDFVPSTRCAVKRVEWAALVVDACGPKKILGELSQLLDAHSVLYLLVEHGGAKDDNVSAQRGVAAMARLVQMPSLRVLHSHSIDDTVAFLGSIARCGVRWHIGVFLAVFVVIFLATRVLFVQASH
eukprot:g3042.t1